MTMYSRIEGTLEMADPAHGYPSWMADLPEELHSKPLNTLAIPGSHDSSTKSLNLNGGIAPGFPRMVRVFARCFPHQVYNWSLTQHKGFYEQLIAGIRYLDLRVAINQYEENKLYFCHGLFAQSVAEGLSEVVRFIEEQPKEIVFLAFNNLFEMNDQKNQELVTLLQQKFSSGICPAQPIDTVTLTNLWKNKQQVLIFYQNKETIKKFPFLWSYSSIPSPWPNTDDVGELLQFLTQNYQKGRSKDTFYVTQGVLTPSTCYVCMHICGGSLEKMSDDSDPQVMSWLKEKDKFSGPNGINICILDFATDNEYIPTVLSLNNKYKE